MLLILQITYMKKILSNPVLILILRLIIGYIFITYGIGKISNPGKFANEIANYSLFPESLLNIFAIILPWLEVIVGIMVTLGMRLKSSSFIAGLLMISFIFAVLWAIAMGLDINCGCSSTNPQKIGLPKLLENSALLISTIIIFLFSDKKLTIEYFTDK